MDFDLAFKMSPVFVAIVPLAIALVGVLKTYISEHYAPLLSLGVGMVLAVIATDTNFTQTVFAGLTIGLAASGAYSGVKKMVQ